MTIVVDWDVKHQFKKNKINKNKKNEVLLVKMTNLMDQVKVRAWRMKSI